MSRYTPERQAEINAKRAATIAKKKEEKTIRDMRDGLGNVTESVDVHENTSRPQRVSVGARLQKLDMISSSFPLGPEWHKCWVEDDNKGNFEKFHRAWYEPIRDENGDLITFPSGPYRMVLMKVLTKYYLEDQELLAKENSTRIVKQIALGPNEYAPGETHPTGGSQALVRDPMR